MNTLKSLISTAAIALVSALPLVAAAQAAATPAGGTDLVVAQASTADMTDGEIRKVDKDTKKITIKHGEIKNLDMPPMTMVFQVKDASLLDKVKAGEMIRFTAEKTATGAFMVTDIQPAK